MPRRSLWKSIPSVPQVIDVLENGTEKKYMFFLCHCSDTDTNLVDKRRFSLHFWLLHGWSLYALISGITLSEFFWQEYLAMKTRLKPTGMLHILLSLFYYIIFHSGFTTQEKELYSRILELIPILVPVMEGCTDNERAFEQFVKSVCVHSLFHI